MAYKGTNHISARVQHSLQVIWCALCPSSLEYTLLLTPQGSLAVDFRSLASGRYALSPAKRSEQSEFNTIPQL